MFGIEKYEEEKGRNDIQYAMLLKKYMSHIMKHESITYTTDSKIKQSGIYFTEDEIKILKVIASEIN